MDEQKKSRTCFLICPIGGEGSEIRKRSDDILKHLVRPAASKCGYETIRADEIEDSGNITFQVIKHIMECDIVIADLFDHNPNVFYELGIRHSFRRPVILIAEAGQNIPFDVSHERVIFLKYQDWSSLEECKQRIVEQIRRLEEQRGSTEVDSPISIAVDIESLRRSGNLQDKNLVRIIERLEEIGSTVAPLSLFIKGQLGHSLSVKQTRPLAGGRTIRELIMRSKDFCPSAEEPDSAKAIVLFRTSKQQTWLVATSKRLYCILDDIDEYEPELRWSIAREDMVQEDEVTIEITAGKETVDIGDKNRHWYYSNELFEDTNVAIAIRQLIEENMIEQAPKQQN